MTNILLLAYDYLDELKQSDYYKEFINIDKELDLKYSNDLEELKIMKDKYDEIMDTGGRHHPDFKEISNLFSTTKKKVFQIDIVKRYLELERQIEEEINSLFNDMSKNISSNIPVFNKFGFIEKNGGKCDGCR